VGIFPGQVGNKIESMSNAGSTLFDFWISRFAVVGNGCKPSEHSDAAPVELSEFGYFHDESRGSDGPNL
jgi:hypothetical protein